MTIDPKLPVAAGEISMAAPEMLLRQAWQTRRENFPDTVEFVYPRLTLAVRTTGTDCPLQCAHCGGHYLKGMAPLQRALSRQKGRYKSFLLSGACDRRGRVRTGKDGQRLPPWQRWGARHPLRAGDGGGGGLGRWPKPTPSIL